MPETLVLYAIQVKHGDDWVWKRTGFTEIAGGAVAAFVTLSVAMVMADREIPAGTDGRGKVRVVKLEGRPDEH